MKITMDSTFKRTIFIVIDIAIGIIFLYTAFFYEPTMNQKAVVIYFTVVQILIFATYFSFRKQHAYRRRSVKKLKNPHLQENAFELSQLLLRDYDYIRDTAKQAMNDRHTMVNYFLLITGASATIIAASLKEVDIQQGQIKHILAGVALIINFVGWIYFMHIVRLRQAWHGSALAMNQIKEFFIQNGRVPDEIARSAFLWDTKFVPGAGKKSNVFYYSTMLISFISSLAIVFASITFSFNNSLEEISNISWTIGLYHFIFQMICYSLFLDYSIQSKQS